MKNAKNNDNAQLIEMAKKKLRWYAMEASEEEFDEEAVDALVTLISTLEETKQTKKQSEEEALEQFRQYCKMRMAEEETEGNICEEMEKKTISIKKNSVRGTSKAIPWAVSIAAASVLILLVVGGQMSTANASEEQGFFHWLRKGINGFFAVTSPDALNVVIEEEKEIYCTREEMSKEERMLLPDLGDFTLLGEHRQEKIEVNRGKTVDKIEEFLCTESGGCISMGVVIYEEQTMLVGELYEDYKLQYSNTIGEYSQQVFAKENENGKMVYFVCFNKGNIKYFVKGVENVDFLEKVSQEYMQSVEK
ncbi:MAG: hypothetical protein IJF07_09600 [Lachnospiraceae bacterium]|nr:hypothetical protein [Lachnospiraceae bacterium]